MNRLLICMFTIIMGSIISHPAHALFDARLTYGLLASKPDMTALFPGQATVPAIAPTYGLGADVIVSPPLFPLGFGLRYENMGVSASSGSLEFKANYTRTAVLINYRIIDTLLFLGPIFSYGLSHSGSVKAINGGTEIANFSSSKISSYSVGLEAGAKLIGFNIGAEAGIQDFRWKDAQDSTNTLATQDLNLSGSYMKVLVGFGI